MLRRALPALLLVLALLAGCGGGGDDGPQTKEGFINDADGVCEKLAVQFEEAGNQRPGTAGEVSKANNELADLYEKLSGRLSDVRLPDTGAARTGAQEYILSIQKADPLLEGLRDASDRFLDAAKANNARALTTAGSDVRKALDAFRAARAASDTLAVSYGMNVCGGLG